MLLSCGSNAASHLALGHGVDVDLLTPTLPLPAGEIVDLVSTSAHTLLLVRDDNRNYLYGVGTNTVGQLGTPCALRDEDDKQVMRKWTRLNLVGELEGEEKAEDWQPVLIGASWTSTFVVYRKLADTARTTGADHRGSLDMVVACGSNDFNELGYADPSDRHTSTSTASLRPRVVDVGLAAGEHVEMLGCGQRHVMLVFADAAGTQRVVGWGAGRRGEMDIGTLGGAQPAQVSAGSKGKGKAASRPSTCPPTPIQIPLQPNERIIDISLGASHTIILTSSGRVLAWGSDGKGQIAGTSEMSDVSQVSASWNGSYLLTRDGKVLSQGANTHSQLLHDVDTRAPITVPEGWTVEKIVAGSEHLLVLLSKDDRQELWTGGWNEHGNLALGDHVDRSSLHRVSLPAGHVKGIWAGCASTWVWLE